MVTASSGARMPQGLNPNAVTDSCVALGEMAPYSYPDGPLGSFGRTVLAERGRAGVWEGGRTGVLILV